MPVGYSGSPLVKKPGIKPDYKMMTVNEPEQYFNLLGELPEGIKIIDYDHSMPADLIHLSAKNEEILHSDLPPVKKKPVKDGMLWNSWINGSSNRNTDINGNDVRKMGL